LLRFWQTKPNSSFLRAVKNTIPRILNGNKVTNFGVTLRHQALLLILVAYLLIRGYKYFDSSYFQCQVSSTIDLALVCWINF